jgi:predicted kinase
MISAAVKMRQDGRNGTMPFVVLLTGLPAAGKTTLSHPLANALGIPCLRGDSIKEAMFDSIGYSTLAWSEFLTVVSKDVAFRMLPELGPCVMDVFMPREEARQRLRPTVKEIIEIHCSIPYETAWERFAKRAKSGDRHPGHVEAGMDFDFYVTSLRPQHVAQPFALGGPVLEVDTAMPVDFSEVCDWARREMAKVSLAPGT